MNYCSFDENSDLYIFEYISGGYVCCGCAFHKDHFFTCKNVFRLLIHVYKHVLYGNKVPNEVFQKIYRNILTFKWINKGRIND